MNLITQRFWEKEIKEVEKDIEECERMIYGLKQDIKNCCDKGCYFCTQEIPNEIENYKRKKSVLHEKLQTLKKILAEEKEFVKRLKEKLISYFHNMILDDYRIKKRPAFWIENIIDNLSIHSPQSFKSKVLNGGESSFTHEGCNPADNEPESVGNNCLYTKQSCKNRIPSGFSNFCKNCGKPEIMWLRPNFIFYSRGNLI